MPDNNISVLGTPVDGSGGKNKATDGPKYNQDEILLESDDEQVEGESEEDEENELGVETDEEEVDDGEAVDDIDSKKPDIPFDRPTISEIKTEFPEIFKKFPSLKESYFREIEFTKIFPTIEDARESFEENEAFSVISDAALEGNPVPIFDSLAKTDAKAFEVFSLSFLPELYKKDSKLYADAVTPLFQNLVRSLYKDKDENTKNAALVLAEYLFGDDGEAISKGEKSIAKGLQVTEDQKKQKESRDIKLSADFRSAVGRVQDTTEKHLESLILKNPAYDPNKVFSPFLRKQGAKEVIARVQRALEIDKGHMTVMAARWKRARANGYTSDDESKIVATYLARAKSLIPDACAKVSAAMMGTKVKVAQKKQERIDAVTSIRRENLSGRAGENHAGRNGKSKLDYSKMSDMEILES